MLIITHREVQREYNLNFSGSSTIQEVKRNVYDLTVSLFAISYGRAGQLLPQMTPCVLLNQGSLIPAIDLQWEEDLHLHRPGSSLKR